MPLTDAQLKARLQGEIQDTPNAGVWDVRVASANKAAQNEIYSAMAMRGYAPSQTELWDRFDEFNEDIGLYWLGVRAKAENADGLGDGIKAHDRRAELKAVPFTMGGRYVPPATVAVRRWGVMSNAGMMFPVPRRLFGPNALPADTSGVTAADQSAAAAGLSDGGIGLSDGGVALTDGG